MTTTATGITVFLAILVGGLGLVFWAVGSAYRRGRTVGRATVTADEAADLLARAQAAQEAERDIETIQRDSAGSAVERLRASKWNRDKQN